jgi:thiol:disulfide interchange protein DsbD
MNYGYEGDVLHLVDLAVPSSLPTGRPVTLAARADWLVCKETCIPEGADLTLELPVSTTAEPDARWGKPIAAARAALPKPLAGWQATATGDGPKIALKLVPPAGAPDPGTLYFFANDEGRIEPSRPQTLAREGNAYVLTLPVAYQLAPGFQRVAGVLSSAKAIDASGARAATLDVPLAGSVVAGPKPVDAPAPALSAPGPAGTAGITLPIAALLAFVGGVILNLMPCVFPVLSLKVLGFVQHHDSKGTLHREALAFAAGVILTFVALGLALAALRAAGEQLGWGFQLQSPAVVTALAVLFFLLALNLSGVFEFGMLAPSGVAGSTVVVGATT